MYPGQRAEDRAHDNHIATAAQGRIPTTTAPRVCAVVCGNPDQRLLVEQFPTTPEQPEHAEYPEQPEQPEQPERVAQSPAECTEFLALAIRRHPTRQPSAFRQSATFAPRRRYPASAGSIRSSGNRTRRYRSGRTDARYATARGADAARGRSRWHRGIRTA